MSIVYPLSLPTSIGIAQIELRSNNLVALSESPFTFKQQVFKHPGERWEATVSLPRQRKEYIEPWIAFMLSLKGQSGTFLLGDPNGKAPQGVISNASVTVLTDGAAATGDSQISVKNLPLDTPSLLVAGDYIQLGHGNTATLHKVLMSVDSDAEGKSQIEFWPALRRNVQDEEVVVTDNAVGKFRLSNNGNRWSINDRSAYQFSFEAMEAL